MTRNPLAATVLSALLLAGAVAQGQEAPVEAPTPTPTPCAQGGSIDFGDPNPSLDPNLGWKTNGGYSSCHENWQLTEGRWVEFSFCGKMDLLVDFLADDDSCVKWPDTYFVDTAINGVPDDRWELNGVDRVRIPAGNPLLKSGTNRVRLTVVGDVSDTEGCYLDTAKTF